MDMESLIYVGKSFGGAPMSVFCMMKISSSIFVSPANTQEDDGLHR